MKRPRAPSPEHGRGAPLNVHSLDHHGVADCQYDDTESSDAGSSGSEVDDSQLGNLLQEAFGEPAQPAQPSTVWLKSEAQPQAKSFERTKARGRPAPQKQMHENRRPR